MVSNGVLSRESMVWKKGMAAWAAASSVEEIAEFFNNVPPPIA
jgi:hypothetical protein